MILQDLDTTDQSTLPTLSSHGSETSEDSVICGPFACSSCFCRWFFAVFTILVLFITGLGIGLAIRDEPSTNALAANIGGDNNDTAVGGGDLFTDPPGMGSPPDLGGGDEATPEPTEEMDGTDDDFALQIDDNIFADFDEELDQELLDTSNSPYLVG